MWPSWGEGEAEEGLSWDLGSHSHCCSRRNLIHYAFAPLQRLHLSEDVAGATFMAAGSSAPELFTSVIGRCHPEEHLSSVLPEERGLWKQEH